MTLDAYLRAHAMTDAAFAKKIGRDRSLVSKYRRGRILPPLPVIVSIERATGGQVSYRDFVVNEDGVLHTQHA